MRMSALRFMLVGCRFQKSANDRQAGFDRGATPHLAADREHTTDPLDALRHPRKAEMALGRTRDIMGFKSASVILDLEHDFGFEPIEADVQTSGPCVFDGVGHRFLADAEQVLLLKLGEVGRLAALPGPGIDPGLFGQAAGGLAQGGKQGKILAAADPEIPHRVSQLILRLAHQIAGKIKMVLGLTGGAVMKAGGGIKLQGHAGEALLNAVVEFLGEAGAFADHGFETDFGFLACADLEIEFLGAFIHPQGKLLSGLLQFAGKFLPLADFGAQAAVLAGEDAMKIPEKTMAASVDPRAMRVRPGFIQGAGRSTLTPSGPDR